MEWAQDLAHRIAIALEHTRLFDNARELFEPSASANWVGTPDGRILACNQMFAQLLGFESIADAMTTPALLLYEDAEDGARLAAELSARRRIAGRETTFKGHDNGRPVCTLVNAVGEFDDAGRLGKYGIVTKSGGYVWLAGASGAGTMVTVCLPVVKHEETVA